MLYYELNSDIYYPHVSPNQCDVFLLWNTKGAFFKNISCHSFHYNEVKMVWIIFMAHIYFLFEARKSMSCLLHKDVLRLWHCIISFVY